jgi:16S rRNA (uracil1498-N3)-methyltransferase
MVAVMHTRFYAPTLEAGDAAVRLPIDEGRHLTRVLRLRMGDAVRVFNGAGLECDGRVDAVDRDQVTIAVGGQATPAPEAATRIRLVQAVLKGDCMDGVVRDAVMLGVSAIVPLISTRVEGDRRSHGAAQRVRRWERIAIASAKQCGRAVVPAIAAPLSLPATLSSDAPGLRVALVEPIADLRTAGLGELAAGGRPSSATLFVGPEGGWTEDELRLLADHETRALTLGRRTLRAESAAIVGLSVLQALWGEFD